MNDDENHGQAEPDYYGQGHAYLVQALANLESAQMYFGPDGAKDWQRYREVAAQATNVAGLLLKMEKERP